MQPPATLPELIDQLGRTYSPFERLKILGRGWSLLRSMTPQQRMIVAAQLGLDHADDVVEAIAKRSGQQASPALIAMIEKAQVKGTPYLPELIADLRDPKRRAERLKQGAAAIEDAVAGPAAPQVLEAPPALAASATPPPPVAAPPPQIPEVPAPTPALSAAQPPPVPEPEPEETIPPPRPVAAVPAPQPRVESARDSALAAQLAAAPALTVRFRLLRRHLEETKGMSAAHLGAVLETFPDGWARRRALLELLRAGVPGSLDDAFSLIETLGSDRDRLWCLGTLADSREIPEGDREALLAAASSPAARRRLERRLGR